MQRVEDGVLYVMDLGEVLLQRSYLFLQAGLLFGQTSRFFPNGAMVLETLLGLRDGQREVLANAVELLANFWLRPLYLRVGFFKERQLEEGAGTFNRFVR